MPKHIICMGANTFVAVTGRATGFGDLKSSRYFDQRLNAYVYATEHHAAALFNNQVKDALIADLKRFIGWMQTPKEKVEAIEFNPPIHVASTIRSLRIMQRKIREAGGIVAVDTETQGLNPYIPGKQIRCIQFCWDAAFGGVFVPLGLEEDCFFTRPSMQHNYWQEGETLEEAVEIVREILLESQCIWHSGKFDRIWLHEWGRREFGAPILAPNIYMDTLHVAHAINENRSLKLKQLITTELGYPTYDINDKLTKDLDILIPYSTRDTVASLLLALKYSDILKSDNMQRVRRLYAKVTRRCDPVFTKMELRGWPVNGKTAAECKKTINVKLDETETAMLKCLRKWTDGMVEAGLQGVDKETEEPLPVDTALFASTKKLSKLLFVVMRLPMNPDKSVSLTDGGEPSTDEDALIHLKGDEFVDLLLEWRGLVKALSTYVEPMIRAAKGRGRLTTSYRLTGTVTGRTASGKEATQSKRQGSSKVEGMNLQNLPYTWDIRNCIEAREGWSILEADFSQVELRIAGWLAKDPLLLKAYSLGWDIHAVRAMRVNGLSQEEWDALPKKKRNDLRKKAKAVNFGLLYGMQARKFKMYALTDYGLDIPYKECVEIRNQFFDDHTGLPGWYERQENECVRKGYVESPDGRRRHLPNIRHNPESSRDARTKYNEAVRMAINTPVQGFASDLKLMSIIEIDEKLEDRFADSAFLFGEVHDSILLEVRNDVVEEVTKMVLRIMNHPRILDELGIEVGVPITADAKVGQNYGQAEEYEVDWQEAA
jgi:DNA polymerase-1